MNYFTPTWHPTEAENYFKLYNDLNQNDDTILYDNNILYYDSTTSFIETPKIFYYKRTKNDNYDLQLNSVITNTDSDNPIFSPTLPATEGNFIINKIVSNSGSESPTIDLYCRGNIGKNKINVYPKVDYDVPTPSSVNISNPQFKLDDAIFPTNSNVGVLWSVSDNTVSFNPSYFISNGNTYTYQYEGDYISFTTNWNNETKSSTFRAPTTPLYFSPPNNLDNLSAIPTVYCNWQVNWGYVCTSYSDVCTSDGCSSYGTGYIPWSGTYNSGYYIRTGPGSNYPIAQFTIQNYNVTVIDESGDWYECEFTTTQGTQTGWVNKNGISGNNPNSGGGGCGNDYCNDDYCYNDFCINLCNNDGDCNNVYCGDYTDDY